MPRKDKGPKTKIFKTLQDIFDVAGAALMKKEVVAITPSGDKFRIEDVETGDKGAVIKLMPADTETPDTETPDTEVAETEE